MVLFGGFLWIQNGGSGILFRMLCLEFCISGGFSWFAVSGVFWGLCTSAVFECVSVGGVF